LVRINAGGRCKGAVTEFYQGQWEVKKVCRAVILTAMQIRAAKENSSGKSELFQSLDPELKYHPHVNY
jgi:hypothetical protein